MRQLRQAIREPGPERDATLGITCARVWAGSMSALQLSPDVADSRLRCWADDRELRSLGLDVVLVAFERHLRLRGGLRGLQRIHAAVGYARMAATGGLMIAKEAPRLEIALL